MTATDEVWLIKARKKTTSRGAPWWFVADEGRMNRVRVHARQFYASKVDEALAVLRADNPEYEFKKQPW